MIKIPGYKILDELYRNVHSVVYRARRESDNLAVIIKTLNSTLPTQEEIERFDQELSIMSKVSFGSAFELIKNGSCNAAVFNDFGAESLQTYLKKNKPALWEFLILAIRLTGCLQEIHNAGIIHKNIHPGIILYNPTTGQVGIIDFHLSSLSTKDDVIFDQSETFKGDLRYISPEQTGRINRSVDWRTDLYSLGITLYEMLLGFPPFEAKFSYELIHAHIALDPLAPQKADPQIPEMVAKIVLKLISKRAEDRYNSAKGVILDLEECYERLDNSEEIQAFPIGRKDLCDRFVLPSKLYGRAAEMENLLSILDVVSSGNKHMVLVSGAPGVGKTSLIREINRDVTAKRGWFITSKYDQFVHDIPYSALIGAFRDLIHQLLTEEDESLVQWKERLQSALSPNCQVIIDLIPELELITGPQPPVAVVKAEKYLNRLKIVFHDFIELFCKSEHPLVIFLDDMQWADGPSISLIETIMSIEHGALMLVCAYRDNEMSDDHPLMTMVGRIQAEVISRIHLSPINDVHVAEILCDILHRNRNEVWPLVELVHKRTEGNPFFVGEFLKTLDSENLLSFNVHENEWSWDLSKIEAIGFKDNVVDFVIEKLSRLPPDTQLLLSHASMLGNIFDLNKLSFITEKSPEVVHQALKEAINRGFIVPFIDHSTRNSTAVSKYVFSHDRIQQAAYNMIPEENREAVHLNAGRLLLTRIPEKDLDNNLFSIIDQLNKGKELIVSEEERTQVAWLNYEAGKKAKNSAAFSSAFNFFENGINLLGPDSWHNKYSLSLSIHTNAAETAYLSTDLDGMEQLGEIIVRESRVLLDRIPFYSIKIKAIASQGKFSEALDFGLDILDQMKIHVSHHPSKINLLLNFFLTKAALRGKPTEYLTTLPDAEDPQILAKIHIIESVLSVAYVSSPKILAMLIFKSIRLLNKEKISCSNSRYFMAVYGTFLAGTMGDVERGFSYVNSANLLANRPDAKETEVIYLYINSFLILHWKEHLRNTFSLALRCHKTGLDHGNLEFAGYGIMVLCRHMMLAGIELSEMENNFNTYLPVLKRLKLERSYLGCLLFVQVVDNLKGLSKDPCVITGVHYNEEDRIKSLLERKDLTVLFAFYYLKMYLNYLFGRYDLAVENSLIAHSYIEAQIAQAFKNFYYFYDSLVQLAGTGLKSEQDRHHILKRVKRNQKKLKELAKFAPMNYGHKVMLVEAELGRALGKFDSSTENYYEEAIKLAGEHKYLNEEALANELAAQYYLDQTKPRIAKIFLTEAHAIYTRWGATAKVRQLEQKYSHFFPSAPTSINSAIPAKYDEELFDKIDLASVTRAAQVISSEIVLKKLVDRIMKIVIQNAGADRGWLIMNQIDRLVVRATIMADVQETSSFDNISIDECQEFCGEIVRYSARKKEIIIFDNTLSENLFKRSPYIIKNKPQSILCMPILNQGELLGLLYLENNKIVGAFTSERVKTLRLISSQIGISLKNSLLYEELANEIQERKKAQENYKSIFFNASEGIFQTDLEGRIILINPAGTEIMGYDSPEEVMDTITSLKDQFYADASKRIELLELLKINGTVSGFEFLARKKDKTLIELSMNIHTVKDTDGNILYLEGNFIDATAKKRSEQLRIAKEAADAAVRAKSEFLARMSHEIRTPMNAIIGYSDLITRTGLSKKQLNYLRKMRFSARMLLQLINDILDFSKIEAGKMTIESIGFKLDDLINGIIDMMTAQASENGIKLIARIRESIPKYLKGDPHRLSQVLVNLVSNAVKFTRSGHVLIEAELVEESSISCSIEFSVSDTGIGMTKEQVAHVFENYAQAYTSITRQYGGTGLGLSISKQLLTLMGSELHVASEYGKGSTFSFCIGFPYADENDSVFEFETKPIAADALEDLSGVRLLLVEDNTINQEVALELLTESGIVVDVANNGREAIDKLNVNQYDLVLMDIEMPVMDGYEATSLLRNEFGLVSIPIIAMSAHAMEEVRQKCLDAGMSDYISKPIDPKMLFVKLSELIKLSSKKRVIRTDIFELADNLPGIDVKSGIERLMGNKRLYVRLLDLFFKEYESAPDKIKKSLLDKNYNFAASLTHKIKGAAGNLSAINVYLAACDLEIAINEKQPDYDLLIATLEKTLRDNVEIVGEIENILNEKGPGNDENILGFELITNSPINKTEKQL